jgi:hypothetical protein
LVVVALLGITLVGRSAVDAQDTATPDASGTPAVGGSTETDKESAKATYLATLAEKLGITTEELQTAIDAANDVLGADGWFGGVGGHRDSNRGGNSGPGSDENDSQYGGAPGNTPGKRGSVLRGVDPAEAATFLGITEDELKTELKTSAFLQIAENHGKTTDDVRAFLILQATAQIDERLQAAETAPASDSATEPAEENTSISDATEVPAAPTLTPTATA